MEVGKVEFELPEGIRSYDRKNIDLHSLAIKACDEGWVPDDYFASQDTFFERGGKQYARTTKRRWV